VSATVDVGGVCEPGVQPMREATATKVTIRLKSLKCLLWPNSISFVWLLAVHILQLLTPSQRHKTIHHGVISEQDVKDKGG
jgi:hypothetical protein